MKLSKKLTYVIVILDLFCVAIGAYLWLNHSSTIVVRYVDANGTSVTYDKVIKTKSFILKDVSKYYKKIDGYSLEPKKTNFVFTPLHSKVLTLTYKPKDSKGQISKFLNSHYYGVTFQPMSVPEKNGVQLDPFNLNRKYEGDKSGRDSLRLIYSDNGINWSKVAINYPKINVRDPSMAHIGNGWFIVYTHGLIKTNDFVHWQKINWTYSKKFTNEWAPEFIQDANKKWYVVESASNDNNKFQLYISDFNPLTGTIINNWKRITGINMPKNMIDGHIDYENGEYYLWFKDEDTKKLKLAKSDELKSNYNVTDINANINFDGIEGPETVWTDSNKVRLYFDTYDLPEATFHGVHYVESDDGGYTWSNTNKLISKEIIRHFQPFIRTN